MSPSITEIQGGSSYGPAVMQGALSTIVLSVIPEPLEGALVWPESLGSSYTYYIQAPWTLIGILKYVKCLFLSTQKN